MTGVQTCALPIFNTGIWHHVSVSYDGTDIKIYLDGVLDGIAAKSLNTGSGELRIGFESANAFYTDMNFDEVYIYNKALTTDQITALYNQSSPLYILGAEKKNWSTSYIKFPIR